MTNAILEYAIPILEHVNKYQLMMAHHARMDFSVRKMIFAGMVSALAGIGIVLIVTSVQQIIAMKMKISVKMNRFLIAAVQQQTAMMEVSVQLICVLATLVSTLMLYVVMG
jgi:hypothetical protein